MPQKQSKANLYCFRCQVKLGKILNRGTFCPICRRKICKKCLASSNLNRSLCQNRLHTLVSSQTLLNQRHPGAQLATLKPFDKFGVPLNSSGSTPDAFLTINNNLPYGIDPSIDNNNEHGLSNKNLTDRRSSVDADSKPAQTAARPQPEVQNTNQNATQNENQNENQSNILPNNQDTHNQHHSNDQQAPRKVQRKNAGLYIKRATSSAADSLAARRYRPNLRTSQPQEAKYLNNSNKQLSKSCSELTQDDPHCSYGVRSTSEQNLNADRLDDEHLDKSASLPKFTLNRLISKLKRSHTVGNVNDIGKRSSLFSKRSNSLKNQYGPKSDTLWKRSSAKTLAAGHQLYLKTLNLGKKGLFKGKRSQTVTGGIQICKLKGICTFCCKKM